MRSSRRSPGVTSHICPVGLRCSCVPIRFDNRLVGVAKVVVNSETSDAAFSSATDALKLVVSETCKGSLVAMLSEEVGALRQRVAELHHFRSRREPPVSGSEPRVVTRGAEQAEGQRSPLVERAVAYLQQHYQEPNLSLPDVAESLGCNPMYLTNRFTQVVGEHMHRYLAGLRVAHACRLLMGTDLLVKETACASGFLGSAPLARTFRRYMGVSPGEYRRIFTAP